MTNTTSDSLGYIGINNWPEKAKLLTSTNYNIKECKTESLVYDCERHIDFLSAYQKLGQRFKPENTLYHAFYIFTSNVDKARYKCDNFIKLYEAVKHSSFFNTTHCGSITEDGMRLDGSHRASIAFMLGIDTVIVKSYSWPEMYSQSAIRHIHKEFRIKAQSRLSFCSGQVFSRRTSAYLGELIYIDCLPQYRKILRWNLPKYFTHYQSVFAIKSDSTAVYVPKTDVLIHYSGRST